MKILSFSYCFPNKYRETWGVFVAQRLAALSKLENVELEVCAPIPWFPVKLPSNSNSPPYLEIIRGLLVHHPRYFYIPRYMKHLDARFYARGLFPWVEDYCIKKRPEILDAHFAWPDGVGVYHLAHRLKLPYAITQRGWTWVGIKQPKLWNQAIVALRNASVVINLCSAMADICREIGCEEQRLHVIHNGIDRDRFYPMDKIMARKMIGLPVDAPIIACISFFQRRKGILELIESLSMLSKDTVLVLVGDAVETDYYKEILRLIETLGLTKRVIMPGPQPHDRVALFMNAANVTALPSYWEGSPNAVVESLGCGTPVVATPVGSVEEQIKPGENGYIVPMKCPDALAEALNKALERDWHRESLTASVKSWDEVALDVQRVFKKVINT